MYTPDGLFRSLLRADGRYGRGLASGLALTGAVFCNSQWPATPFSFSHASMANNLDAAT